MYIESTVLYCTLRFEKIKWEGALSFIIIVYQVCYCVLTGNTQTFSYKLVLVCVLYIEF